MGFVVTQYPTELQSEIDREAALYVRQSMGSSVSTLILAGSNPISESPSASPLRGASTAAAIPDKIQASYTEIHELASEKCLLAQRLVDLITQTRSKLDFDIARVRLLQGDPPELVAAQTTASANLRPAGMMNKTLSVLSAQPSLGASGSADSFGAPGRNPALAISESLRNALGQHQTGESISAAASPTPSLGHVTKSMA